MSGLADPPPVAAVDCGTNSTRLLVLSGSGRRLDRRMRITRLGRGVDSTGRLDAEAIEKTLEVIEEYHEVLVSLGVRPSRTRAAATSAARDASNSAAFLDRAERILGVRPEVIEGTEEGRLSYLGATSSLDDEAGPYLVVDVGGGSTELIVGAAGGGCHELAAVVSVEAGCVRMTERYLLSDPPLPSELESARIACRQLLARAVEDHPALRSGRRLVGVAGTVSALTVLSLGLEAFDETRVHLAQVSRRQISSLTDRLSSLPLSARRKLRGLEPARADVIVAGAVVLGEVMDTFGFEELTASESDILDGLATELLAAS